MHDDDVPTKSIEGQNEIAQRSRKLSARQRMLLISVNGNSSVAELRKQFGIVGDFDELMLNLVEQQLVNMPSATIPSAATVAVAETRDSKPPIVEPTLAAEPLNGIDGAKKLMTEIAFANLGMRAYMFTIRLEHCHNSEELQELLPDFTRLLASAKGEDFANALEQQLEAMLATEHPSA